MRTLIRYLPARSRGESFDTRSFFQPIDATAVAPAETSDTKKSAATPAVTESAPPVQRKAPKKRHTVSRYASPGGRVALFPGKYYNRAPSGYRESRWGDYYLDLVTQRSAPVPLSIP